MTTPSATATTVQREIVVEAPPERAFATFVERFDAIEPREHDLLTVDIAETVFEPHVGGHIADRGVDGCECRWARVLAYEPPHRIVFSWDITPRWTIATDPDRTSQVEVRFLADGEGRTRVALEHHHLDRHGDGWETERDSVADGSGWSSYLDRYAGLFTGPA